jgi:hypothetical protein
LLHLGNYLGLLYHIPQSKGNNRLIYWVCDYLLCLETY